MNAQDTKDLVKQIKQKGTINVAFLKVVQKKFVGTLSKLNNVNYNTKKDLKTAVNELSTSLEKIVEVISTFPFFIEGYLLNTLDKPLKCGKEDKNDLIKKLKASKGKHAHETAKKLEDGPEKKDAPNADSDTSDSKNPLGKKDDDGDDKKKKDKKKDDSPEKADKLPKIPAKLMKEALKALDKMMKGMTPLGAFWIMKKVHSKMSPKQSLKPPGRLEVVAALNTVQR